MGSASALAGVEPVSDVEASRPNIVLIVADDLGWTDLASFGSRLYETPHLDRLAREGVRFTSAYSNGLNCSPARAALLSGQQYPNNPVYTVGSGARGRAEGRKLVPPPNQMSLPTSHVSIARALAPAGYATGHVGKWHVGEAGLTGPLEHGFQTTVGKRSMGPRRYFSPYMIRSLEDAPPNEYLTYRLGWEAVRFIESHRAQPFFLYLAHYAVHTPLEAPPELVDKYLGRERAGGHHHPVYAAMIEALDRSVGDVLATLDRLGLTERTMVLFFSDNGGAGGFESDADNITDNAPLRGGKGQLYEGGIRVPLVVRYPPWVPEGAVSDEPVQGTDFYPTFLELAGARPPEDYALDGVSLLPVLRDPAGADLGTRSLFWHFPGYVEGPRPGAWRTTPSGVIRRGDHKLMEFFEDDRVELYDLRQDIGEGRDLASELPEQAAELRAALRAWRERVGAPMPARK